ncbi:MAG TPA: aldo/keto reductase, partial [Terriglobales bacterium]
MKRREFIATAAAGLGAVWLTRQSILDALADSQFPRKYAASDTVTLGGTGITTSRLAMGTGTVGSGKHSNQTALGIGGLSALLL